MDETWNGGFYEAAIVLGKTHGATADRRLVEAITTLWSNPRVRIARPLELRNLDEIGRIEGVLEEPTLGALAFGTVVVREREMPNGDDWLYAVTPLGGLAGRVPDVSAWPAGDEGSRRWREPLERTLAELALDVARVTPITLAMIGYEIAGIISAFTPNEPRRIGYVTRDESGAFVYSPTTDWG